MKDDIHEEIYKPVSAMNEQEFEEYSDIMRNQALASLEEEHMPIIQHAVTIPSLNNAPNPSGALQYPEQPGPSPENLLQCSYPCTIQGHNGHSINLLWCAEQGFSLDTMGAYFGPDDTIDFVYSPPLI